jgi:hypothetical protein
MEDIKRAFQEARRDKGAREGAERGESPYSEAEDSLNQTSMQKAGRQPTQRVLLDVLQLRPAHG